MKKILLFFNPTAGRTQVAEEFLLSRINLTFPALENLHSHILKGENKSPESIKKSLDLFQWDLVIVAGGDGTVRRIVEVFIKDNYSYPLGILPLGSANGLATCLGMSELEEALEAMAANDSTEMDILTINDNICLHLSDFGFNAGLVAKYEQIEGRGMITYLKGALSELFENKPYQFNLQINGKEIQVMARMLLIANGNQYGTGAIINPAGRIDDGMFEILAFNPDGIDEIVNFFYHLMRGELKSCDFVKTWKCTEATIQNPDGATFQIDGDVERDVRKAKIGIMKNRLKVIINPSEIKKGSE
ncbi:NAD(+)/NADH kinase [Litoribacter ruber]|uniref:NAD(+)/NADH kinase n=1 Tax=Litoribacter ruber TaxID=702568 RepID=A0AAP2G5X8_9BACT|nr:MULTISPECIES: diacylglycerol kinase family protein [Litoribacter]MBS9525053.1 NAD(+)/NADH kinase [Litoribacter alkaliphilus]MBT0811750.1 NAD(+)/NADH kinase [Litoribacter ruber]